MKKEDLKRLPTLPIKQREKLPSISAIYFVMRRDTILYIGKADNLRARWRNHHKLLELEKLRGIKIAWLEVAEIALLIEIEKALINHFQPSLNTHLNYAAYTQATKKQTRIQEPHRRRTSKNKPVATKRKPRI